MAQRVAGLVLLLACTACGVADPESSLSQHQAFARARHDVRLVARAAYGPGARVVAGKAPPNPIVMFCDDRYDPPRGTPLSGGFSYRALSPAGTSSPPDLDQVSAVLRAGGWRQDEPQSPHERSFARAHFALIVDDEHGYLSITAETPCVRPADPDDPLGDSG